jgi:hypothetical protein
MQLYRFKTTKNCNASEFGSGRSQNTKREEIAPKTPNLSHATLMLIPIISHSRKLGKKALKAT